jgi:non-ribosomal peptide synthetase-like protein
MTIAATLLPQRDVVACDGTPQLLHQFFERQVVRRPHHPAVEFDGGTLTYAELDARANRIAHMLHARGVGPGALVGLYFEKSCLVFAALLGVLKAGAGYVPIDPKTPMERVDSIVNDAALSVLLSGGALARGLPPLACRHVILLDQHFDHYGCYPDTPLPEAQSGVTLVDTCYVIFTSGSTGRPKGVVIEHRNAVNFVRSLESVYRVREDDRIYQGFSLAFDASVEECWAAFSLGGTLVVPSESIARSPHDAADFIKSERITYFSTVPSFLAMVEEDLPTVRLLVVGGEDCPAELVSRWAPGRCMLNTYGPTEATVVATAAECIVGQPVTIGTALPGYTTYVLDENLRPVGIGESGELFIGGHSIARGYLNRTELTGERFIPDRFGNSHGGRLYRTYDLVRLTRDGELQFIGRKDSLVKIRGFRVELSEIETILIEQPAVRAAAVTVRTEGALQELAAFVVPADDAGGVDNGALSEALRQRLPEYMIPKYLDVIQELPRLTSGKLDRNQLPASKTLLASKQRETVSAETALEADIVEVFQDCFCVSPIFVSDDFFLDLGGHSLLVARVVTALRSKFNTSRIAVRDIYEHRTIRQLAHYLQSNGIGTGPAGEARSAEPVPADQGRVSGFRRWRCACLQAVALLIFHAVTAGPPSFLLLISAMVFTGEMELWDALVIASIATLLVWPSCVALSIGLKWAVIGRYKPGRYPVWGGYYFRWWLVSRFQSLSMSGMLVGTPLMSFYYRAMGAKVGRNSTICTPLCTAFDLVSIGENTSIGAETQLLGYRVEDGWLILDKVAIGDNCFVGAHSNLALNVRMGDGSRLEDMSLLADGQFIPSGEALAGSPAVPADVRLPSDDTILAGPRRPFVFGLIHLGLIYLMGYLLLASVMPGVALVLFALGEGGPLYGAAAAFAAMLLSAASYLLIVIAVKRLAIGRISPGVYRQNSAGYLRLWFLNYLLENTRQILLPLYATLAFPKILRLLGAKMGKNVEVSTVMHITPDLLEISDGSFLADACLVGGQRVHGGLVEVSPNKIGARTFVGNSALVPGGVEIGDDSLIGVMSTPPSGMPRTPDSTRWLGSPSFELPSTQSITCFAETSTYRPSRLLVITRFMMELVRLLLPAFVMAASLTAFACCLILSFRHLPLPAVLLMVPCLSLAVSVGMVATAAGVKRLIIGAYEPVVAPLWSPYIWANEIVNGLYESTAAIAMAPFMGTPFLTPCLRAMGCKVGRWVFLETTLFSEFDLVEIGDHAALNLGVTVQTHLFEDRIMKSDRLKIGDHCSIGNMSAVLYGTEMRRGSCLGPLSLLMKGETLPPASRWYGIPTQLMNADDDSELPAPPTLAKAA